MLGFELLLNVAGIAERGTRLNLGRAHGRDTMVDLGVAEARECIGDTQHNDEEVSAHGLSCRRVGGCRRRWRLVRFLVQVLIAK